MADIFYPSSDDSLSATDESSWATARNKATADANRGSYVAYIISYLSGTTRWIERFFLNFNTAAIPDGDTITAASLFIWIVSNTVVDSPSYRLYGSTAADTITTADYDQMTTTELSDTYLTNPSTGAYFEYPLNAAGISAIVKDGITKFCVREATYDVGNVQPGGGNLLLSASSLTDGTANDPYLSVTHAQVATGAPWELLLLGVGR